MLGTRARELLLILALAAFAGVRVGLNCASFPFFGHVDEIQHVDMLLKYSSGHLPNVAEDHQTYNARSLADDGAAILLPEAEMDSSVVRVINEVLSDTEALARMRVKMKSRARPDAAITIAASIIELAGTRAGQPIRAGRSRSDPLRNDTFGSDQLGKEVSG